MALERREGITPRHSSRRQLNHPCPAAVIPAKAGIQHHSGSRSLFPSPEGRGTHHASGKASRNRSLVLCVSGAYDFTPHGRRFILPPCESRASTFSPANGTERCMSALPPTSPNAWSSTAQRRSRVFPVVTPYIGWSVRGSRHHGKRYCAGKDYQKMESRLEAAPY